MSSLTRMLSVLDLFSRDHMALTAEQIAEELKLTRTTSYRYIGELMQAGLLVSTMGVYTLGPRIIQLDYRIRESDPLLNSAVDVLAELARNAGGTGLLASIYNDQIINIYQETPGGKPSLTYSRGKAVPTFRSASSKVILSNLKPARLKRIWAAHQHEPDVQALGAGWEAFLAHMQTIKAHGYWVSHGELDPGADGIAAPILFADGDVAGSMTLVFSNQSFKRYHEAALGEMMLEAVAQVTQRLPGVG